MTKDFPRLSNGKIDKKRLAILSIQMDKQLKKLLKLFLKKSK